MFVELVWPIIFGLLASMLVSFTLTALLCANLLRHEEARDEDRQHPVLRLALLCCWIRSSAASTGWSAATRARSAGCFSTASPTSRASLATVILGLHLLLLHRQRDDAAGGRGAGERLSGDAARAPPSRRPSGASSSWSRSC